MTGASSTASPPMPANTADPATPFDPADPDQAYEGSLYVIVAPSGAGKTSLVRALLGKHPALQLSVSHTTRAPREGEVDGVDYFFVDSEAFQQRQQAGEFIESALVHGNYYGTSGTWISERIAAGDDILLEIDWQGAIQVQQQFRDAVGIFIAPPSIDELRTRLKRRGQDAEDVIARRVETAAMELREAHRFQYVIINQDFASALVELDAVVRSSRTRYRQQRARHASLFNELGMQAG